MVKARGAKRAVGVAGRGCGCGCGALWGLRVVVRRNQLVGAVCVNCAVCTAWFAAGLV